MEEETNTEQENKSETGTYSWDKGPNQR